MKVLVLIGSLFLILTQLSFAQQFGSIKGTISDVVSGETLPGATVTVDGTTLGVATDLDGNFFLNKVPVGKHSITCNFISYSKKIISDVEVNAGETSTLNISLEEANTQLAEVVITASAKQESNMAFTLMQKNNMRVADGITSETIKKTPDRNTSDVLKRVSGTTIQDNKFVIIRGLNDRYNAAFLNGAPLPSTESDRKAFSFDIFPAAMLDNITILKTATPDMPADFAGGVVQINTKAIPDENTQSVSVSSGFNTITTFKNSITYQGGKYDIIGIDDGTRSTPNNLPNTEEFREYNQSQMADAAKLMKNDWALERTKAPVNSSLQYSLGRRGKILKNDAGSFFALTYNNTNSTTSSIRKEYEEQSGLDKPLQVFEFNDSNFTNNILAGALWNASYNIGSHSQFSIKNIFNINTTDQVTTRNGARPFDGSIERGSARIYTQNIFNSHQLGGNHVLGSSKIKIDYTVGYSRIERSIPNLRRMVYVTPYFEESADSVRAPIYSAAIPSSGTSPNAGGNMFWSKNLEEIKSGALNASAPLNFMPENFKTEIKGGVYSQIREREFSSRQFGYSQVKNNLRNNRIIFEDSLLNLSEDQIFAAQNMGVIKPYTPAKAAVYDASGNLVTPAQARQNGVGGFKLEEVTKLNDKYSAQAYLNSGYLMFDHKIYNKLRFIWGVRAESYRQRLQSFEDDGDTIAIDTTNLDFLPSANLIYSITEKLNIRASYYKTLSRPEFRELAPFGFFDYVTFFSVRGNPSLKRATVNNYDFRFEYYPSGGQIITTSFFYKEFKNAIEQINRTDIQRQLYYSNVPKAQSYGVEVEYRLNFGHLFNRQDNQTLLNTSIYSNASYIVSKVDVSGIDGSTTDTRPLQGQSPFIINAGAQYNDNIKGYNASIVYNIVGRRILIVGNDMEPHIYENPRGVLDFQAGKVFFKKLDVKINVRDILAQNIVFYQDINADGKYKNEDDNTMVKTNAGRTISLILAYKF